MPNVQLPPKESNLFKRILVSGRRPRRRCLAAPVRRGRFCLPPSPQARPPHLGRARAGGPTGPPGPLRAPPPSAAASPGTAALVSETSGCPWPSLRLGRTGQVVAPVPAARAVRRDSRPPRSGPPRCVSFASLPSARRSFPALCVTYCTARPYACSTRGVRRWGAVLGSVLVTGTADRNPVLGGRLCMLFMYFTLCRK